jgi:hypothetical protein
LEPKISKKKSEFFVKRVRREMINACPCRKNGQNKDTLKDIRINI